MGSLCRRLRGEQDSESMFDADAFLRVEEYVVAAQAEVAPKVAQRAELVGIPEVAELLGVKRETVDKWRRRGRLPEPGWVVGGSPVWEAGEIRAWAKTTGRAAA
jgi:predicted DNA-binding transcriptional regulator AlpA